ncbi:hypothetical protein N9M66_06135 [Litoreibacter sp.]|nr:hypothetical protein [Litoreibacter sp.]
MLNSLAATLICATTFCAAAEDFPPFSTTTTCDEIARIDPSKTLELIRRIKTASGGVAS